eukprot:TRINITY_DN113895_c0_g1_i1.p1 TRINITY_DN113895_c0_g1~~TRINITY_DN113895_c0_g1_i1.p1  ORF type:complete len:111 (+),score=13.13 TRINITY_DN113895_c0_g1_i1:39-335(+)
MPFSITKTVFNVYKSISNPFLFLNKSANEYFVRHVIIGSIIGLGVGGLFKYYHISENAKISDYYTQLAIANEAELKRIENDPKALNAPVITGPGYENI